MKEETVMFERDRSQQKKENGMVIGFDLGRYAVQISYYRPGMEGPETAEQVMGSEVFNIPMVLCKRAGINQWFYGREALKHYEKEGGVLVDSLFQKAVDGEVINIEGEQIEGIALLALFIKRSLSILGGAGARGIGSITDIMFTCENLAGNVVDIMTRVTANLSLKNCNVYFQSYAESIYHYMIHQDEALWKNPVFLSHYDGQDIKHYIFRRNPRTTPEVVFVDETEKKNFPFPIIITEDSRPAAYSKIDEKFADYMSDVLGTDIYSSIYLLGDGFKDEWLDKSIKVLCRNRRLFVGNDLFSRGACYSLQDKYEASEVSKTHVYLGEDKLKSNIGLNVLRRGEESYLALLDAGINWYEAEAEFEMFLPEDHKINFVIIPLDGSGHINHEIEVLNFPERDPDTLRIRLEMKMSDVNKVKITITDEGFGEIAPGTGAKWDYSIDL